MFWKLTHPPACPECVSTTARAGGAGRDVNHAERLGWADGEINEIVREEARQLEPERLARLALLVSEASSVLPQQMAKIGAPHDAPAPAGAGVLLTFITVDYVVRKKNAVRREPL